MKTKEQNRDRRELYDVAVALDLWGPLGSYIETLLASEPFDTTRG